MIVGIFKLEEHPEYGSMGLRLADKPHFDPLGGLATIHDLLEHFADDRGDLASELEALGASIYVRNGEMYYLDSGSYVRDPAHHISGDMPQQVRYTEDRCEYELRDCGPSRAIQDEFVEGIIQRVLEKSIKLVKDECEALPEWLSTKEQRRRFVGWLRRGYRRASDRYKTHDQSQLGYTFGVGVKEVDKFIKHFGEPGNEGMRVKVSIDIRYGRVFVEPEEEW